MDSLNATLAWALLVATSFVWAGITEANPIQALGIKITSSNQALGAAGVVYIFANMKILILLSRLGSLTRLLDKTSLLKGLSKLALHHLFANPFGYFGGGFVARLNGAIGYCFLIVLWWFANSSLFMYSNECGLIHLALIAAFVVMGLCSMLAINGVYGIAMAKLKSVDPKLSEELRATGSERLLLMAVGIGGGLTIAHCITNLDLI